MPQTVSTGFGTGVSGGGLVGSGGGLVGSGGGLVGSGGGLVGSGGGLVGSGGGLVGSGGGLVGSGGGLVGSGGGLVGSGGGLVGSGVGFGVLVGRGVLVGSGVAVGSTGVLVGGTAVLVGGTGAVGTAVSDGGTDVSLAIGPDGAVCPGSVVATAVDVRLAWVGVLPLGPLDAAGTELELVELSLSDDPDPDDPDDPDEFDVPEARGAVAAGALVAPGAPLLIVSLAVLTVPGWLGVALLVPLPVVGCGRLDELITVGSTSSCATLPKGSASAARYGVAEGTATVGSVESSKRLFVSPDC